MKTIAQHQEEIMDRTDEIVVGAEYWLSSFHDVDGAYVKVLNKDNINKHLCDNCKPINLYEERNLIYEFRKYNKRLLND